MSERTPTSPYQRYNKKPHVYSPTYQLWRKAALVDGAGSAKALEHGCHHAKMMGVKNCRCEPCPKHDDDWNMAAIDDEETNG